MPLNSKELDEKEKENINIKQKRKSKKKEKIEEVDDELNDAKNSTKILKKCYYPMLAHPFNQKKKEIKYPCFVQPKLDGVRCVAVGDELFSRNGNPFPTLNHIKEELKLNTENLIL